MPTRAPKDTAYHYGDSNRKGSSEDRLMPKIVQRGLNMKVSRFAGAFPAHATGGKRGAVKEERAENRRARVNMAALSPAFPTKPFQFKG